MLTRDEMAMKTGDLPLEEVIERIVSLNDGLRRFWTSVEGWAPISAARLLSKSRLDWQVSLASALKMWLPDIEGRDEPGRLILAWANLGALVEGTMKLFLSVWYNDYREDIEAVRTRQGVIDPESLTLEPMRRFFKKRIYGDAWDKWVAHIQQRRNSIHTFRSREIGNFIEFHSDVRKYLDFLRYVNSRLPYPDEVYVPREV